MPSTGVPITLPGGFTIVLGGPAPPAKAEAPTVPAEKHRELQERLDRLQAIVDAAQPVRPRSCELEGKIEQRGRQTVVRLKATFKVTTSRADTVVHLGCQRAHAVEARADDGKTPLLSAGDDGLRVQLPAAGDHTIRLDLDVPVTPRGPKGAQLGFEVGLPGAAITALSFEPPANVRQYFLTTRSPKVPGGAGSAGTESEVEQAEVERFLPGKGGAPLGPVTSLVMTWEDPSRRTEAVRSAETDVTVTVGPDDVTTEARIRLRGSAADWRFTAPATADVNVGPWVNPAGGKARAEPVAGRTPNVVRPEPGQTVWRVESREALPGDLLVTIATRVPRGRGTRARGPFPAGPFAVLDVPSQSGVIRVRTPFTWKASAELRGDCRREGDDGSGETLFRYRYPNLKSAPTEAPVVLTVTPATGVVHSRVRSTLHRTDGAWRLRSEVSLSPSRAEVEEVAVEVPNGFRLTDVDPKEIVDQFAPERGGQGPTVYKLRLTAPRRTSFTITLHGEYPAGAPGSDGSFVLPRVLGVVGRGSEVMVDGPAGQEIRGSFRVREGGKQNGPDVPLDVDAAEGGNRLRGSSDGVADRVDLRFQPATVGARVRIEADVDVSPSRFHVVQRMSFQFTGRVPARLRLRAEVPVGDVRTSRGTVERAEDGWDLVLPAADGERESDFVFTFTAGPPAAGRPVPLPLLAPEGGGTSSLVRVWAAAGTSVELVGPTAWRPSGVEIVPGRQTLPDLVVRADGPVSPPKVTVGPRESHLTAGPVVDWVRVDVRLGESADYRARFLVRDGTGGVEFVLPSGAQNLEAFAAGKRLPEAAVGAGEPATVRVPPLARGRDPFIIELRYRLSSRPGGRLDAPHLVRGEIGGDVVWTVTPRPGQLALRVGDVPNAWSPRALLAALGIAPGPAGTGPATVIRQPELGSLSVLQLSRSAWILAWSLLAAGLTFGFSVAGRRVRRAAAMGALALGLVAAFVCPQPLAVALLASVPGIAGFLILALGFRTLQVRHRRRAARFAGFARPGSTLVRPSVVRNGEPSNSGRSGVKAGTSTVP